MRYLILFFITICNYSFSHECNNNLSKDNKKYIKESVYSMFREDQILRHDILELMKIGERDSEKSMELGLKMTMLDSSNTKKLKSIMKKYGRISNKNFEQKYINYAWILVQHADQDPEFQKLFLEIEKKCGNYKNESFAMLTDRVLVNDELPQKFGTQGWCVSKGKWDPQEIENRKDVDILRKEYGLSTIGEYIESNSKFCG